MLDSQTTTTHTQQPTSTRLARHPRTDSTRHHRSNPMTEPSSESHSTRCAHCGKTATGHATINGRHVCHTSTQPPTLDPIDCYRLVTVYGETLGSRITQTASKPPQPTPDEEHEDQP
jgi:hypothetical protein